MASKKQEGDGRREKRGKKNQTGHRPKKGREQEKAGQNPENTFAVTSLSFPQRPLTWEAGPIQRPEAGSRARGASALGLNAFFVGKQWTVSEGLHK